MQPNNVNATIGEVTELVLLWKKETRQELASLLQMSSRSLGRRIIGEIPWEAWEIDAMAKHFGLPVGKFFEGPDGLFGDGLPPTTRRKMGDRGGRSTAVAAARDAAAA